MRTFVTVPDVRADRVTAELTMRELSVVVPAGTLNPPLETVTLPADEGLRTILLLDAIRIFPEAVPIDPRGTVVGDPVNTARMKTPVPPVPPTR